jgi:hypothetical protein
LMKLPQPHWALLLQVETLSLAPFGGHENQRPAQQESNDHCYDSEGKKVIFLLMTVRNYSGTNTALQ